MRQNEVSNHVNLSVFRCSCTERGRQCASEFTRANAFAPMLKTLTRKNPGGVTMETIAQNAICPFHARLLSYVRTDIVSFDETMAKFSELVRAAREEERMHQQMRETARRRHERWVSNSAPIFGEKLKAALSQ